VNEFGDVITQRGFRKSIMSGNYSHKIKAGHMTVGEHNWSITTGLISWAQKVPIIRGLIALRAKNLVHSMPSEKIKSM
jgi:hypothetical protein